MTLREIFTKYGSLDLSLGTDKELRHRYADVYEELLSTFREKPITLVEIGVQCGWSMRAWREYFQHAALIGIDNRLQFDGVPDGWSFRLADATNHESLLDALVAESIDVVIDDGSHRVEDQIATAETLIHLTDLYIIEDIVGDDALAELCAALGGPSQVFDRREIAKGEFGDDIIAVWRS